MGYAARGQCFDTQALAAQELCRFEFPRVGADGAVISCASSNADGYCLAGQAGAPSTTGVWSGVSWWNSWPAEQNPSGVPSESVPGNLESFCETAPVIWWSDPPGVCVREGNSATYEWNGSWRVLFQFTPDEGAADPVCHSVAFQECDVPTPVQDMGDLWLLAVVGLATLWALKALVYRTISGNH